MATHVRRLVRDVHAFVPDEVIAVPAIMPVNYLTPVQTAWVPFQRGFTTMRYPWRRVPVQLSLAAQTRFLPEANHAASYMLWHPSTTHPENAQPLASMDRKAFAHDP